MLALPAFLIWRRQSTSSQSSGKQCHSRSFIILGCLLALLFPVVSASDDLHPLSAEIEESGPSKRTVKHSSGVTSPAYSHDGAAAQLTYVPWFRPENEASGTISDYLPVLAQQPLVNSLHDRGPPEA
jgi:hypothetical protein